MTTSKRTLGQQLNCGKEIPFSDGLESKRFARWNMVA